jgi:hypothetical protein
LLAVGRLPNTGVADRFRVDQHLREDSEVHVGLRQTGSRRACALRPVIISSKMDNDVAVRLRATGQHVAVCCSIDRDGFVAHCPSTSPLSRARLVRFWRMSEGRHPGRDDLCSPSFWTLDCLPCPAN